MRSWEKEYHNKLISVEAAAGKINSGDKVFANAMSAMPAKLLEALADRKDELTDVTVVGATAMYPFKIFQSAEYRGKINYLTAFLSGQESVYRKNGNISVLSASLSRVAQAATDVIGCNVLVSQCSPPDEEGYLYFGVSGVTYNWDVAQKAETIILQVNRFLKKTAGYHHRIHVTEVDWLCEDDAPLPEFPQPDATSEELKMVNHILPMIEDGSTLQLGLGGLPNAIGFRLDTRKDLSVHTEMYTDSMAYLAKKGVITGRQVAAFGLGCQEMYDYVAEGHVELKPISIVNDPFEIGRVDKLVSINSCLMADLTGQVCSESIGHRQYSGIGGQLDFVRGAALSNGGKSFLCMPATRRDKSGALESRVKVTLPPGEIVTTDRADVMYVVTEYGVADLYLKPIEARVEAMIAIAHPDFRDQLREDAIREGIIRG